MFAEGNDPTELPTEQLEAELATLYSRISAETCEFLALVAELDRREAYLDKGCVTLAHWLSIHCGIARRSAQEHVRVARCLEGLPEIRSAFAHGELTYSKVRALTRIASPESEAELLELARQTAASQLERVVRAYRRAMPTDIEELDWRRHATIRHDDDGSFVLTARLSAEEGALFEKAFELARAELAAERTAAMKEAEEGPHALPHPTSSATSADALVRVAQNALAGAAHDAGGADLHQVMVHVDAGLLADVDVASAEGGAHRCEVEGTGIAPTTARRVACDASVIAALERDGSTLSLGRKTRSITPALRRALRARDGGCRFPGCAARRLVEGHHVVHWARGGETSLSNLVSLCRRHHHLVHEGGFTVECLEENRFVFRRPSGQPVPECDSLPRVRRAALRRPPAKLDPLARSLGAPLGPCSATCQGAPMDLELTTWILMQRFNRSESMRSAERIDPSRDDGPDAPAARA